MSLGIPVLWLALGLANIGSILGFHSVILLGGLHAIDFFER